MPELIDPRDLTSLKALVTSYKMESAALLSLLARKGWLSKSEGEELMRERLRVFLGSQTGAKA